MFGYEGGLALDANLGLDDGYSGGMYGGDFNSGFAGNMYGSGGFGGDLYGQGGFMGGFY